MLELVEGRGFLQGGEEEEEEEEVERRRTAGTARLRMDTKSLKGKKIYNDYFTYYYCEARRSVEYCL